MDVILQLDLARQKETPETLAEAIDFAAANGYILVTGEEVLEHWTEWRKSNP